ncbi:MAG: PAS domain S-box protein, partial [Nitrospinota bacterium]|nr:PAS domain S-box protein [Nitrospinota bacterium]
MAVEKRLRLLYIEDDDIDSQALLRHVRKNKLPYEMDLAATSEEALEKLSTQKYGVVLMDIGLPDARGTDLIEQVKDCPVIMVTGAQDAQSAVETMRKGAYDFLTKDKDRNYFESLPYTIENAISRWNMEQALKKSEEQYRSLVDNIHDAMFLVQDGEMKFTNKAFENIFGCGRDSVVGKKLEEFINVDYMEKLRELRFTSERSSKALDYFEVKGKRQDGLPIDLVVSAGFIQYHGSTAIIGTLKDITAHKKEEERRFQLESRINQLQRLESLGVLAGGIAHDFNNLLSTIFLNVDNIKNLLPEDTLASESLEVIRHAAKSSAALCRQMLTYSGKEMGNISSINLNRTLNDIRQLIKASISKNAELTLDLPKALPDISADATQIRQVIMNLVTNASEALGNGEGKISIRTGEIAIDGGSYNDYILYENLMGEKLVFLEVRDTGCGMDEETRRKIFEPFFSTKFAGRGLGMATVFGIVRKSRGAIKISSEPGEGSVFTIIFPAAAQEAKEESFEFSVREISKGEGTILLVDDEEHLLNSCEIIL